MRQERREERAEKRRGEEKIVKVKNLIVNDAIPTMMTESLLKSDYCGKP